MKKQKEILVPFRLPAPLATDLRNFCKTHCLRMNKFISKLIGEKLREEREEEEEISLFESRENEPTFSEKEWLKILKK